MQTDKSFDPDNGNAIQQARTWAGCLSSVPVTDMQCRASSGFALIGAHTFSYGRSLMQVGLRKASDS